MANDVDIEYSLDPSGYLSGVNQIDAANQKLSSSMVGVASAGLGLSKAMALVTPGRAVTASFMGFAKVASDAEEQMSTLAATSVTTGANLGKLGNGVKAMARDLPIGRAGAIGLYEQFTKMGVAAAGTEEKIGKLAKTSANLAGATGEGPAQLAQGMTELARATGNQNLNPKRFEALADSLTTVSTKLGASATNTLSFAKNIAPMAQAAGIGSTSILGISAAFSRLGEDGLAASSAVNKMLSDMTRSVREGGPQMRTYAQIAGMTADEFERLFKAKPTEAVTRVLESIGKAGTRGPRMLEQIGIEGVRGQRAIQNLVSSGQLRTAVSESTAAYGSGSTQKAAEAAFGGLNDQLGELGEATKQVAEAFGQPLLKPLTGFSAALTGVVGLLGKVVGSGPGQALLTAGLVGAGGLALGKGLLGPLAGAGLLRQGLTAGPPRAVAAALAEGLNLGPNSRIRRYGAPMQEAAEEGKLGKVSEFLYNTVFEGSKEMGGKRGPGGMPGPGFMKTTAERAQAIGLTAVDTYIGMATESFKNATKTDPRQRNSSWGFSDPAKVAGQAAKDVFASTGSVKDAGKAFDASLRASTGHVAGFGNTVKLAGVNLGAQFKLMDALAGDMTKAGAKIRKSVGGKALEMIGGGAGLAGIGVAGAITYGTIAMGRSAARDKDTREYSGREINETFNEYRDSTGRAAEASLTFADATSKAANSMVQASKSMSFEDVKKVTADDMSAASASMSNVVHEFSGTVDQIAAQVQLIHPSGFTPEDLSAVKVDLARQLPQATVQQVMDKIPGTLEQTATPQGPVDISKAAADAAKAIGGQTLGSSLLSGGFGVGGPLLGTGGPMGSLEAGNKLTSTGLGRFINQFTTGAGGGMSPGLSDEGTKSADLIVSGIGQELDKNSDKYGGDFGLQQASKSLGSAMKQAAKDGNADLFNYLAQKGGKALFGADTEGRTYSAQDFAAAGNDPTKIFADMDDKYAKTRQDAMDRGAKYGADVKEGEGVKPVLQISEQFKSLRRMDSFFASAFDTKLPNSIARTTQAFLNQPEKLEVMSDAVDNFVNESTKAGKSLGQIYTAADQISKQFGPDSDEAHLMQAVQAQVQTRLPTTELSRGQLQAQNFEMAQRQAMIVPTTGPELEQRNAGRTAIRGMADENQQMMKGFLTQVMMTGIQAGRARQDVATQAGYMKQDVGTSRDRATASFDLNMQRMQYQAGLQVQRMEEDFYKNRERTLRDFHENMRRAEEDYQISRAHQIRDFNRQLARQIEDAAATLYDPYSRIQTKATYDAQNLLVNLQEQTDAMTKQKTQLDALRKAGVSGQAIDILGLGKTENAQQLNNLMEDMMSDPSLAAALNKSAAARAKAAGALVTDESNKDLRRQKEDLAQSLSDAADEHARTIKRANKDLAKGLADAAYELEKTLRRNNKDLHYAMAQARKDLDIALGYMEADLARSLERQNKGLEVSLGRMTEDLKNAQIEIAGSYEQILAATSKALKGEAVDWSKITTNGMQDTLDNMKNKILPQLKVMFAPYGVHINIPSTSAGGVAQSSGGGTYTSGGGSSGSPQNAAEGGSIEGYSPHTKADNIPIMATAGEYMQPVDTVKHYGVNAMEAIKDKKLPKDFFAEAGYAAGGLIEFGKLLARRKYAVGEHPLFGGVHGKHATGSQHYNKQGPGGGGAIDVNADPWLTPFSNEKVAINQIVPLAGSYGLRTIWLSAGHFDHAHFDISKGPDMVGGGARTGARSGTGMGSGGYGGGGSDVLARITEILTKGFDQKRGWPYGNIRDAFTKKVLESDLVKLVTMGAGAGGALPGGDTGSHGSNAKANQDIARQLLSRYNFSQSQMASLIKLWNGESGWNQYADNPGSDAYGIPQSLPGSKMASEGRDWQTNPETQIKWGLKYIKGRYGSPDAAWRAWNKRSPHWYDDGGWLAPGATPAMNGTGAPEAVLAKDQWAAIKKVASMSGADLGGVRAAGGVHIVVNNRQSYSYDQRNDFSDAHIVVKADDPDAMARQLEVRTRRSRLTQTRGVRR